jgi:hypothetical protein
MRFDTNAWDAASGGSRLIDTAVYGNPSPALGAALTSGSVHFGGANAMSANGGARAKLYAPGPWQQGSSLSHLDEAAFPTGTVDALMTPFLSNGEVLHATGPVTLALLRDIGWSTPTPAPTPTPSPTPTPTPTPSPRPTATPTATPPADPTPPATPTPTATPLPTATPPADPTPPATPTPTATPLPTATPSADPTPAPLPLPPATPPPVELRIGDVRRAEGDAGRRRFRFRVILSRPADVEVTARFRTVARSAAAGTDFIGRSGTARIAPGTSTTSIVVRVIGGTGVEPDEVFVVRLSAPTGALIADATGRGTIIDDDLAAPGLSIGHLGERLGWRSR